MDTPSSHCRFLVLLLVGALGVAVACHAPAHARGKTPHSSSKPGPPHTHTRSNASTPITTKRPARPQHRPRHHPHSLSAQPNHATPAHAAATAGYHNDPPYSWKACEGNLPFTTAGVTLTPDHPHHGRTMTFQISGTSTTAVTAGSLHVIVYYSGWHVWSESQDLCKAVACPVQPGQAVTISNAHKLPVIAPPGAYKLKFSGHNQDNVQWVCVEVAFHVSATRKPAVA